MEQTENSSGCKLLPETRKIVIAEDHTILKEGLKRLLSSNSSLEVLGEARDGLEAVDQAEFLKPDLVLMDISMPLMNGIEAIQEIKMKAPNIKILVLTVHKSEDLIMGALKNGADGYILKNVVKGELFSLAKYILASKMRIFPQLCQADFQAFLFGLKLVRNGMHFLLAERFSGLLEYFFLFFFNMMFHQFLTHS